MTLEPEQGLGTWGFRRGRVTWEPEQDSGTWGESVDSAEGDAAAAGRGPGCLLTVSTLPTEGREGAARQGKGQQLSYAVEAWRLACLPCTLLVVGGMLSRALRAVPGTRE